MVHRRSAISMLVLGLLLGAAGPSGLGGYLERRRVVVAFAGRLDDPRLRRQQAEVETLLRAQDDRNLAFLAVAGDRTAGHESAAGGEPASALRRRFGVAEGRFAVRLVGKDGEVKLSSDRVVPAARLAATIDAMPMRRQEMQAAAKRP